MDDSLTRALRVLGHVHSDQSAPVYLRLLRAAAHVRAGSSVEEAQSQFRVKPRALAPLLGDVDPIQVMFGWSWALSLTEKDVIKASAAARKNVGQLLLGRVAERVFEGIYKREMHTEELRLEDDRAGRTDTDYRVLNGQGRRVFRINIKFHGSEFRNAQDLVGLDPSDCFALATYKILQGQKKEAAEVLPYLFVVVSALGLRGESVGDMLPHDVGVLATLVRLARPFPGLRKRDVEDGIVSYLLSDAAPEEFLPHRAQITQRLESVTWRVLSAKKADKLLRDRLFDRVYAVSRPRFAQNYPRAEVDMHFSLSQDLTPLTDFLRLYKEGGLQAVTAHLTSGLI